MFKNLDLTTPIDVKDPPTKIKDEDDESYSARVEAMALKAMGSDAVVFMNSQLEAESKREEGEANNHTKMGKRQAHEYEVHHGKHRKHRSKYDALLMVFLAVVTLFLFGGSITTMGAVFEKAGIGANLIFGALAAIPFAAGLLIPKILGGIAPSRDTKKTILLWMLILAVPVFLASISLYSVAFGEVITSAPGGTGGGGNPFDLGDLSGETAQPQAPTQMFKIAFIASLIVLDALMGGLLALYLEIKVYDRRKRKVVIPAERKKMNKQDKKHRTTSQTYVVAQADGVNALAKIQSEAERIARACLKVESKRAGKAAAVALAAEHGLTLHDPDDQARSYPLFHSAS